MTSPARTAAASATPSAVLPVAVGPTTATTGRLLHYTMRPNCFSSSFRVSLRTQGRPWGQKGGTSPERIFSASAISSCGEVWSPALMAARQEMECEHPLCPLVQRVAAAVGQLCRQLDQQILGTALLYVSGHGAQADRAAAKIAHLETGAFQQVEVGQQSGLFLGGELHHQRLQEELTGDIAVVGGQFLEELALMGGVLVNDADLVAPLREDIGAEDLAHIPQRLRAILHIKAQLLRLRGLRRLIRVPSGGGGRSGAAGTWRPTRPCDRGSGVRQVGVRLRVHIQLCLSWRLPGRAAARSWTLSVACGGSGLWRAASTG